MNFDRFLFEDSTAGFSNIEADQLNIIKQEINRDSLRTELEKEYVEKSEMNVKIVNNEFYASGLKLESDDEVVIKGSFIAEILEEDGYVYHKPVDFVYNISTNEVISVSDNDSVRNENWKDVQSFILRSAKKI